MSRLPQISKITNLEKTNFRTKDQKIRRPVFSADTHHRLHVRFFVNDRSSSTSAIVPPQVNDPVAPFFLLNEMFWNFVLYILLEERVGAFLFVFTTALKLKLECFNFFTITQLIELITHMPFLQYNFIGFNRNLNASISFMQTISVSILMYSYVFFSYNVTQYQQCPITQKTSERDVGIIEKQFQAKAINEKNKRMKSCQLDTLDRRKR